MSEIFGNTTTTPINPDAFSGGGGGGSVDLSNYYTKDEIDNQIGDIETALDNIIAIQNSLIGGGNV